MDRKIIAKKLRELRGERTLETVSVGTGLSVQALCNYESAIRIPRDEAKMAIAKYYGVPVVDIFFTDKVHEW
ncbi:MAG: helix-turn-helix transcriptional regulator [Lachnospiraceae bacterium]|nr:helix-turn-helix transcriptional regulator [Lachnospiraceae bacterium]